MDPLSISASIISVLQLTSKFVSYMDDVKNATREQRKVLIEASNLHSLLTGLRFQVEDADSKDPWFNQVKLLGVENGPLDQFKECLERLLKPIMSTRKRDQVKLALTWTLAKSDVEQALRQMERLKTLVNCALTNDLKTLSLAIHEDLTSTRGDVAILGKRVEQINLHSEQLQSHVQKETEDRLAQWLQIPDPSTNYHAAIRKRNPETGSWFLDGKPFRDWRTAKFSLMWLHGMAGCGKTLLSAAALQSLLHDQESSPNTVVAYFYFDFNFTEKQSSDKAIRTLLFQLAQQVSNGFHELDQLCKKCKGQQPTEDAIQTLFRSTIRKTQNVYILMDALDECTERENLLEFIADLYRSQPDGLRILTTSRREKDIEEYLEPVADHKINIQNALVNKDIRIYVQDRLSTDVKLKNKWPKLVQDEISTVMMEKANGMFRWVFCQMETIRHCVKLQQLRDTLSALPKSLDDTYDRILKTLKAKGLLNDATTVLQWLCCSNHAMRLSEIIEVLAIEMGDNGRFSPEERLPDPADILEICSSLISCDLDEHGDLYRNLNILNNIHPEDRSTVCLMRQHPHEFKVRLAHFSVKEYLLSEWCDFRLDFASHTCHTKIAEGCLRYLLYLSEDTCLTRQVLMEHPLANYAADNWSQHVRQAEDEARKMIHNLTMKILTPCNDLFWSWLQEMRIYLEDGSVIEGHWDEGVEKPLCYAARHGMPEVVEAILKLNVDVNARGGRFGNALLAASHYGYDKVARVLLAAGANVNSREVNDLTALQSACWQGHREVVRLLLDAGAAVHAQGGHYGNALQAACSKGHKDIVHMLLDAGADVNAQTENHGTALQLACYHHHRKIVELLLDSGAKVYAEGGGYGNSMKLVRGDANILRMLLDAGADANTHGEYNYILEDVLLGACSNGDVEVAKMLLNAGAKVNAPGKENRGTALQAALLGAQQWLDLWQSLRRGSDSSLPDSPPPDSPLPNCSLPDYSLPESPAREAKLLAYKKIVQTLLDAGAERNSDVMEMVENNGIDQELAQMLLNMSNGDS